MKPSRFNRLIEYNGEFIIFNSLTTAMATLNEDTASSIQKDSVSDLDDSMKSQLAEAGFVVPSETDELALYRHEWYKAQHDMSTAGFSISPTMNCNMKCSYCLAYRDTSYMTGATADKIVSLLPHFIKPASKLVVNWFGGEPLLALDIVQYISQKAMDIAEQAGIEFSGSMFTNAYELTPDTVDKLYDVEVRDIVVAVDGPKAVHERRRPHATGKPCFDQIINNVIAATEKLDITLQCIIDADNRNSAWSLFDMLSDENKLNDRLRFRIGRVDCDVVAGRVSRELEISRTEFDHSYIENLRQRLGHPHIILPYPALNLSCSYQRFSVLSFDPDGDAYNCIKACGDKRWAVGSVDDLPRLASKKMAPWIKLDPCLRDQCRDCSVLPLCSGGCAYVHIDNDGNKSRCMAYRWTIEEWMKLVVDWRKAQS